MQLSASQDRFETILNSGGFVDVFVPIYGTYSHGPPHLHLHHRRLRQLSDAWL